MTLLIWAQLALRLLQTLENCTSNLAIRYFVKNCRFINGPIPSSFFILVFLTDNSTPTLCIKIFGFERWTSDVRSDHSVNWATTEPIFMKLFAANLNWKVVVNEFCNGLIRQDLFKFILILFSFCVRRLFKTKCKLFFYSDNGALGSML